MKHNISFAVLGLLPILSLTTACSDDFLQDKKNYDNVSVDVYNNYDGALSRLSDIYAWCLPDPSASANWKYNCTGVDDDQSKSTEEYAGFSPFVDPDAELTSTSSNGVPDYYHQSSNNIQTSVWGRIRNVNDCIAGIENSSLSDEQKKELLGQAYFFRAWCYYQLVKWYGGVPIVRSTALPTEDAFTPRSSAKECFDFILDDLKTSASMLKDVNFSSDNYGRVTESAVLALKGRILLLWASPLFNRSNDKTRWQKAYEEMKSDMPNIKGSLYQGGLNVNGGSFAALFSQYQCDEAVFVTLCNNVSSGDGMKNNAWESFIRPKNANGKGGKTPSSMIVNLFPMSDGGVPATVTTYTKLQRSEIPYDIKFPFANRDPRFYRTFAFPGVRWAYNGDATQLDPKNPSYNSGKDYVLWSYVWYTKQDDQDDKESGELTVADNLSSKHSLYVRKRTDDFDINKSSLYNYNPGDANAFAFSGSPYIEIRYAEVLLNFAEAACGAGHPDEAMTCLQQIRSRAGLSDANNYGLQAAISSDQAVCMSAILYERQIEFAYEGKRFDDLRRWLLFDGGTQFNTIDGAPTSWNLTGWDGNTCVWLGFTPLNGLRRETIEYHTKMLGSGTTVDDDPLVKNGVVRCEGVDLNDELEPQIANLKAWYDANLEYKEKKGDSFDSNHNPKYIHFFAKYYLLGLSSSALSNDIGQKQTIGWVDATNANGTFDPLAQ